MNKSLIKTRKHELNIVHHSRIKCFKAVMFLHWTSSFESVEDSERLMRTGLDSTEVDDTTGDLGYTCETQLKRIIVQDLI